MKNKITKYHQALVDLDGDAKIEMLETLQNAREGIEEFKASYPSLTRLAELARRVLNSTRRIKEFLAPVIEAHTSIKLYMDSHLQLSAHTHQFPLNGWYLGIELIDKSGITELDKLYSTDLAKFESKIISLVEVELVNIKNKLATAFPKRSIIFNNIISLHSQGNYLASIPQALAQADGICKDVFVIKNKQGEYLPVGFFNIVSSKTGERPQSLSRSFNVPKSSVFNILMNQLATTDRNMHPLLEGNTTKLADLNRHAILHGESVDYGTHLNSVKAILLLDFITDLCAMNKIIKDESQDPQ